MVTCQFCFPPDFRSSLIKSEAWEARRVVLRLCYRQLPLHPRSEEQNQQLLIKSLLNEPHFWLKYSLEVTAANLTQTRHIICIPRDGDGWSWQRILAQDLLHTREEPMAGWVMEGGSLELPNMESFRWKRLLRSSNPTAPPSTAMSTRPCPQVSHPHAF